MKIIRVRLGRLRVPLVTPFRTALRTVDAIDDLVVMIETDTGHVGWGEAPPTAVITGDTHGSIRDAIGHYIAPRIIGTEIEDFQRLTSLVQSAIKHNSNAKAAVEIALYDLWAQSFDAPLYRLLGGTIRKLTTDLTISVGTTEKMVADAVAAVKRGFDCLKIKVGKDVATDIASVRAIWAAVGSRARLRLDANQGWAPKQSVRTLRALEEAGVELELVEQPVPAHDIDGLAYVAQHVTVPIMADESVCGPLEALEVIRRRAADIINIKLMKTGGISNALRIADMCAAHGIECMMGCMLESSISVTAAAHIAAARADVITRIDLDGAQLGAFNPVEGGAEFDGPNIVLSDAPGLGIRFVRGIEDMQLVAE